MRDWHTVPGKFIHLFVCFLLCHDDFMEDKATHFSGAPNSQTGTTVSKCATTKPRKSMAVFSEEERGKHVYEGLVQWYSAILYLGQRCKPAIRCQQQ